MSDSIVKVKKNSNGEITDYVLSSGKTVSKAEGVKLAEEGMIDGVIFLTSFPCGPDSLVNELVMRKINIPYLNLIIDDLDSNVGIITRLESFIDILRMRRR